MAGRPIVRARRTQRTVSGRSAAGVRRRLGAEIRRLRLDEGIAQRRLASAAGVGQGHLSMIERGLVDPSISIVAAIADILGAEVSIRLYPSGSPRIHDRHQARMVEAVLAAAHPRWRPRVEVGVEQPARGRIDLVLADTGSGEFVVAEFESSLPRLEAQVRRHREKAESLLSSAPWPGATAADEPTDRVHRLLVLRSTEATRATVREFATTLVAAYPASAAALHAALTSADLPWPGDGMLWCEVDAGRARLLDRPPRGIPVGR